MVEVEERDAAADSVRLRGRDAREITIGDARRVEGARGGGKALVLVLVFAGVVRAQAPSAGPAPAPIPAQQEKSEPFQIIDNSFLVEEAFNQEAHIFQNIFGAIRQGGDWQMTFTQEWPAPGMRHQLSYTLSGGSAGSRVAFGDVLLNYRFQALEEGPGHPAFSPRLSAIVPSGSSAAGAGDVGPAGEPAVQQAARGLLFPLERRLHVGAARETAPTCSRRRWPAAPSIACGRC